MRRGPLIVLIAIAVVVVVAASLATRATGSPAEPTTRQPTPTTPTPTSDQDRSAVDHGVRVGWSRDVTGARDAAISAVAVTGEIARAGFITRADMIEVLASEHYAPTLIQRSAAQLDELLGDVRDAGVATSEVVFRELPLTARVTTDDASAATVEVWSVLVVGAPGLGAPRQLWRTITVELVWERADWRVDDWSTVAGPTPALAVSSPIDDLAHTEQVLAWPAAGGDG